MANSKLSDKQWSEIRLAFESGGRTIRSIAAEFGISHVAISNRVKREGWQRDPTKEVEVATLAKLTGIELTGNDEDRRAAIEKEAERRAGLIHRHRDEWVKLEKYRDLSLDELEHAQPREVCNEDGVVIAVIEPSYRKTYAFKAQVEALSNRQKGERLAWGVDHNQNADRIEDAKKRDRMIGETMGAIKDALSMVTKARQVATSVATIDITPNPQPMRVRSVDKD